MTAEETVRESYLRRAKEGEFWLSCALFLVLSFAFWPVTEWFAANARDQSRLFHALVVLGVATFALVRFGHLPIQGAGTLNPGARRALALSFGLLLIQFALRRFAPADWAGPVSLLAIPAYCAALAALLRFLLGEGAGRITRSGCGALGGFLFLSIFMQPLDWPLRGWAGEASGAALAVVGKTVELGLVAFPDGPPKLILLVDQHPFHVASECNGFGVILTSLLIGLLLALHHRSGPLRIGLYLLAGLIMGFVFNILRIVIIVLLAPSLMEHYHLMHETVGTISYWGCLLLLWLLLGGPTNYPQSTIPQDQAQSESR